MAIPDDEESWTSNELRSACDMLACDLPPMLGAGEDDLPIGGLPSRPPREEMLPRKLGTRESRSGDPDVLNSSVF